jgi:hypothetical protein
MTVFELIEQLQKLDPTSQVILQKDSEGNGYSPLSGVDGDAIYVPENTWSGEVYGTEYTADDHGMDSADWTELLLKTPKCVVLFPVN